MLEDTWQFLKLVAKQWVLLLSGIASVSLTFVERVRHSPVPDWAFWSIAVLCIFVACFLAWRDTYQQVPSNLNRLAKLTKDKLSVKFHPVVPRSTEELFRLSAIENSAVVLTSNRDQSTLKVPINRVKDVIETDGYPTIELTGRLQRVSSTGHWKFFPDSPADEYGNPKAMGIQDEAVRKTQRVQEENGFHVYWRRLSDVSIQLGSGGEIIYDDDGYYFKMQDAHSPQILMRNK